MDVQYRHDDTGGSSGLKLKPSIHAGSRIEAREGEWLDWLEWLEKEWKMNPIPAPPSKKFRPANPELEPLADYKLDPGMNGMTCSSLNGGRMAGYRSQWTRGR